MSVVLDVTSLGSTFVLVLFALVVSALVCTSFSLSCSTAILRGSVWVVFVSCCASNSFFVSTAVFISLAVSSPFLLASFCLIGAPHDQLKSIVSSNSTLQFSQCNR